MKLKVLKEFRDIKDFKVVHKAGDIVDFSDERAKVCISLRLAEEFKPIEEKEATVEPPKKAKSTKSK